MKIGLCQTPVSTEREANIHAMRSMVLEAGKAGCSFAVLPEMWNCPYADEMFPKYAEPEEGETWHILRATARESGVFLVAGSVPERDGGALYNTSYVFAPDGRQIGKHRKLHLFDIDVPGGQRFMESDTFTPGRDYTVVHTPFGKVGVAICFDIRFAELFRVVALEGARLVFVPGAFNMTTGPAHWELSFRMRALDNQYFVAGCSPARDISASYVAYGHSIVCDPWGRVVAELDEKPGLLLADIDLAEADAIRGQIPILNNRRTDLYHLQYRER